MGRGYLIKCGSKKCGEQTWAANIVDLINEHTEKNGKIQCTACGGLKASVNRESVLQEKGETWSRYIQGVIPIKTGHETYTPYVLLTAQSENGQLDGIHFNYFKDTRNEEGGSLKHGHGPEGAPVFSKQELFQLFDKLMDFSLRSTD